MNDKATYYGLGRRKTAIAQVLLTSDTDEKLVNGIAFDQYFPTDTLRATALRPLELASQQDAFGLRVKVKGGGKNSQSEAVRLAVARALLEVDNGFRKQLKKSGTLTRDPRMKERKKPGLKRARRAPQFSKR